MVTHFPGSTDLLTQLSSPRYRLAIPASVSSAPAVRGDPPVCVVAFGVWLVIVLLAQPLGRSWGTGLEAFCYWASHLAAPYAEFRLDQARRLRLLAGVPPAGLPADGSAVGRSSWPSGPRSCWWPSDS